MLLHYLYKCISKVIANRIKPLLPDLISPTQSAFVPRRQISDNILLAQELLKNYHRKDTSPRCAIKVDIQKAFDTIRWDFLLDVLETMGFPAIVNGELEGFFSSSKGLRQGDPLFPYLFVIAMDVLSMIIQKKISEDSSFIYHWRCEALNITHLCFADDLLLFCGNSTRSAYVIKNSLNEFFSLSGMVANNAKSFILSAGVHPSFTRSVQDIFGYSVGSLPINYLGAPLISSKITDHDCNCLLERMVARIKSWTNRFLSFAGRLQLIQSVLLSMQNFWAGLFILPKRSKIGRAHV